MGSVVSLTAVGGRGSVVGKPDVTAMGTVEGRGCLVVGGAETENKKENLDSLEENNDVRALPLSMSVS